MIGLDFNPSSHEKYLTEHFPKYLHEFDYPMEPADKISNQDYCWENPHFSKLDAPTLFVMLRKLCPQRMIEIGSGYSSLLTADVNRRFFGNKMDFICVEPYPGDLLTGDVTGITNIMQAKVEDLPLSVFEDLEEGDILFIDSSHVSKTGSDVNHIYFEILPRLNPGVVIHIHDIFLPFEYLKEWVIDDGRSWNEQYLVRALLMYNETFEVIFGSMYASFKFPDLVRTLFNNQLLIGGSLWIKKER